MAKAMQTIRESLNYPPPFAEYFAANHVLFNRVVAFYFEVIQAHEGVLDLTAKEALTEIAEGIPAMFRRAAINAALGSARSFASSLKNWRTRKARAEAKQGRTGAKKAWRRAPACPSQAMEQVSSLVCGNVERAYRFIHPSQSVDGHLLELGQGAHVLTRTARWL
jgi:putative transposase